MIKIICDFSSFNQIDNVGIELFFAGVQKLLNLTEARFLFEYYFLFSLDYSLPRMNKLDNECLSPICNSLRSLSNIRSLVLNLE
jgi:hypothetical protein